MKKIFIVLLNVIIIFTFIGLKFDVSFASEGSISAPSSVNQGESFTVTVNIPADAVGYQGEIIVKFSNGTTQNSGNLTVVTGITGDYAHPGNMSYNFLAVSEGIATITVSNLKITDRNANRVNSQTTLTGSVSIVKKEETQVAPEQSTTSTPSTTTETPAITSNTTSDEPNWTNTGDTVYALERLNVRSGWGTSYSLLGKIDKGASTTRIAVGSNGWDKISYNGQTGYVVSKYLTTQKPDSTQSSQTNTTEPQETTTNTTPEEPSWTDTGDKVYATTSMNVRSGWATSYSLVGGLKKGDSVTRIAVGSNGWDKIKYDGKTAYVLSRLLTTEKVEPDAQEENTVYENAVSDETENKITSTIVTANMTESELDEYNKLIEEVGVLPTVGKNLADYIYLVAVFGAIVMVEIVGTKSRRVEK